MLETASLISPCVYNLLPTPPPKQRKQQNKKNRKTTTIKIKYQLAVYVCRRMLVQSESLSAPCLRHQESLFFQMPPAYNLSPAPCLRLQEHALSRTSCTKKELYKEELYKEELYKESKQTDDNTERETDRKNAQA